MRFLIDECLSLDLVGTANAAGHEAYHVAHVGRAGWKDWHVAAYARDRELVLVTNNGTDFRTLYAEQPLHIGLIIIVPSVGRSTQQRLFRMALAELAEAGEPVNQVLEIDLDGSDVVFRFYDLPAR